MKFKTVLFDLDGTLIESGPGLFSTMYLVLRKMGVPFVDYDTMRGASGPPVIYSFEHLFGVPPERLGEAMELFKEYSASYGLVDAMNRPFTGVPAMLSSLKKAGIKTALVTSKPLDRAKAQIARLGISDYIDRVAAPPDDLFADKVLLLNELLSSGFCSLDSAAMVGDRNYDINAAKAVGLPGIGVCYGYGARAELEECGAYPILNTVEELGDYLLG